MNSPAKIFSTMIVVFVLGGSSLAQQAARPERGATLNRNYLSSGMEDINLQNGNVQFSIPLASLPPIAGGKLSWTVSAHYNSAIWNVMRQQEEPLGIVWMPYVVDAPSAGGGWAIGGGYSIQFRDANDDFLRVQYDQSSGLPQGEIDLLNNYQWWKVVLVMPDGSERELRPLDYNANAYSGTQDFLRGYYNVKPSGSPMRYYSRDGSFMYAKISNILDWTIYLPDGTRVIQTPDGVQRLQDTNGNKVKIFSDTNGEHYQDEQTGREIRMVYDPAANSGQGRYRVFYKTVTGIEHYVDVNMGTTTVQGKTHPVQDFDGVNENICQKDKSLSTQLQVVRDIVFPQTEPGQTSKFVFTYNSDTTESTTSSVLWSCGGSYEDYTRTASVGWGELSRVIAPPGTIQTAAYTDYSYFLTGLHSLAFTADDLSHNGITQKNLNHDGIVDTWTFGSGNSGYAVTTPDGNNVSESTYCGTYGQPGCVMDKVGLSYRTRRPFVMTERHWINLVFSGGDNIGPGGLVTTFNPVVDYEYTTLLDANDNALKMSAKKLQYDYNGNVTQVIEYDWFDPALVSRDAQGVPLAIPASATVLRTRNTSHYNQASSATSANVYAKRSLVTATPLILNAPKETTVGSSIVRLSYDGQAFNVAPTVGNLTTKEVWADLDSKWITSSVTYDLYGNVATTTDGRGKVTQYAFADATHALPTSVTVDPQNGTGTQTSYTAYDYSTGLVTSQTDANGQVSTIDYTNQLLGTTDPFGRPGIVKAPAINIGGTNHQRRVTTTYLDSARQVVVASDLAAEGDKLLKMRTTTDQLGRTVLTEQTEDGTNYTISSANKYLDMGRVTLTSSPRRSTAASTDSWTRITKDNAGRVIEVATFGCATQPAWSGTSGVFTGVVTRAYEANFTTVTDQSGKLRRSMVDALGRVRRVDEPDSNGSLGSTTTPAQPTSYSYDVFGNLTTVTQGSQTRTFTYDALSRLRTAVNPESGTTSYQYDDNGNLVVKTDARSVSAHFEYDSVNRVIRRWYNGSNSVGSVTHNVPVLPAGVGASNETKFHYDTQSLPAGAPSYTRGSAIGRLVAQTYGPGSNGDYFAYDVLGRTTLKIQQTGTINYQLSAIYNLSGAMLTLTYPSGHTVSHTYDQAARLTAVNGNLGDGNTRTYATGILYSPGGGLVKEQFGTAVPVYNKLFYNSRGQLAEIRASTSYTGPTDYDADRGAIINSYSGQCSGLCSGSTMPDNNGNLKQQDIQIPSASTRSQYYEYDSLNRLKSAREVVSAVEQWKQQFTYDRWGNRLIDNAATYGTGINNKDFTVNTANNRLGVPTGQSGAMTYDTVGNLTTDTYTGNGNRTYDAENKITSAMGTNNQAQLYTYDASGQRIKRTVYGVETWQVYGFGGELVAEYAANGLTTSPQKEYGYRNGQLLITATAPPRVNVAAAVNSGTATASETHSAPYAPSGAINGDRKLYLNNAWANSTATMPQWLQVDFNANKIIDEIDVFSVQDASGSPSEPTLAMTFSAYGLTTFQAQYWNGSAWVTVPNGNITGNNKVWKQITFSPVTTTKIRIWITGSSDGYSRMTEVEAWGTSVPVTRQNVAASANGGTATASQTHSAPYAPIGAINGDRKLYLNNNAWSNSTATFPQWLQVDFNGSKDIDEIDVFSVQDLYSMPSDPTLAMTFSAYGLTTFQAQYWNGSTWVTVPNGSITGNNNVWKQITFSPITTTKIRIWITGSSDSYSRVTEVEAWGVPTGSANSSGSVQWLISDHLGTPRMVLDQTGNLNTMKRHDYLPFGEELVAPIAGRSPAQGYAGGDGVRQQFTGHERDSETGFDYMQARYYSSIMGRFTSADTFAGRAENPQTLNLYVYVINNPARYSDPTGHFPQDKPVAQDPPCEKGCDPDANDRLIFDTKQDKNKVIREPFDWRDLPNPFSVTVLLCPTGTCRASTFKDDTNTAKKLVAFGQKIAREIMETSDSVEFNGRAVYVIDFGARISADGDVFFSFTPPQGGFIEIAKDAIKQIEINKVPFSWSVTSTHMFGGNSNKETRRSFFGGNSYSAGGAIPVWRGMGPYVGGVYSPSSGRYGLQTGVGSGGLSGGFSMSPQNPTFQFPKLAWKNP